MQMQFKIEREVALHAVSLGVGRWPGAAVGATIGGIFKTNSS